MNNALRQPQQSAENRGKVSPILVTLTSRSDSDSERQSQEVNLVALIRILTISTGTTMFERMKKKFYGSRQTSK